MSAYQRFSNRQISSTFAQFPAASAVPVGTVRTASNIGLSPGIQLVSNGTSWRPVSGTALLAQRSDNPVTVQSLTEVIAETLSFVGGFVLPGDRLDLDILQNAGAISTSSRAVRAFIGATGSGFGGARIYDVFSTNNAAISVARGLGYLLVRAGVDVGTVSNTTGVVTSSVTNGWNPNPDFTVPWEINFSGLSVAENAVTITGATWAGGVATFSAAGHTLAVGDKTVVSVVTPSGYNGTHIAATVPDANTFTVAMAVGPGLYTSGGQSARTSNVIIQGYSLRWSAV